MASDDILRNLNEQENFRLGIAAGIIDQCLTQPILYWKNAYIQGLPFTMNPKLIYRGTAVSVFNMSFTTGLQFISAGFFQRIVTGGANQKMSYSQEVTAAALAGACSGPVCGFMELVMIQQQNFGGTIWNTPARIARDRGIGCLMRGSLVTAGREGTYCAGYLGIVPSTQRFLTENYGLNPWMGQFLGASGGGLLCAAISQPLDTAKTCMQGDIERKKYTTMTGTLKTLYKEYGTIKAFYRGYWWRAGYIVVEFLILDNVKMMLAPILFSK